ncbi:MFS sugar transporter [Aspergillus japonicus CBS 114.51]|uniref:MFS sugar transporter n=3 Tax=Aspergillus TaxID=5052 RepID=A0A2V5GQC1_ASPV1|nr:MFS sugar transporter [Aspergillus japonicus CBS 114.51]PYI13295.1 MFS sugar transporter [Aspergillus violaceofuscus CBS 115571]PYI35180.1 MFS sugar transporter [Aspergillus indologenus CBS 114.80]RAH81480.1 MFS sugar transporter [Aspergillus japonicus CBS 114.51]
MRLSPAWYQFLVGVFASLGSFLYGYDLGVIAEVIASGSFISKFEADSTQQGLVVSMFTAGAFCGAAFAGPTGDKLGRRWTITIGCIIFCLGGGLQTGAQTIAYLYSGRFFAGLGVGFLTMIIPLYQAEICHPDIRGRVTALQQFMLGVGSLCAAWISYGTYIGFSDTNDAQWQLPLGLQIAPAVCLGLLIMFFPESPRWLIDHGKNELGLKTLAQLHAHGNEDDAWVRAEYQQIQESIKFEHENEAKSYAELFTSRSSFRRLFLCCAIQASVQMTGVSAIQYYSVTIYEQIGISGDETLRYQAINSIIALIAQFLCILYIDRFGRRWTLIGGNLGNCVTFIVACALLAKFPPEVNNTGAHWGFIIMTWLYNFSFSCTCGPLSWIIPAEVFDTRTRSKGVSLACMVSYAFNTMIGQVTPIAMESVRYKYYYLFIICNFTNAIFFWLLLPETKKLPLEEMNYLFSNSPWIVVGTRKEDYVSHDLERRVEEQEEKRGAFATHAETDA